MLGLGLHPQAREGRPFGLIAGDRQKLVDVDESINDDEQKD